MSRAYTRLDMRQMDDLVNFQLGPVLLYVEAPMNLDESPPSPQASLTGKFPQNVTAIDIVLVSERDSEVLPSPSPKLVQWRRSSSRRAKYVSRGLPSDADEERHSDEEEEDGADVASASAHRPPAHRAIYADNTADEQPLGAFDWEEANGKEKEADVGTCPPDDASPHRVHPWMRPAQVEAERRHGLGLVIHSPQPVFHAAVDAALTQLIAQVQAQAEKLYQPRSTLLATPPRPPACEGESPTVRFAPDTISAVSAPSRVQLHPTARNRLARKSTLTLPLPEGSRHRVRMWRSSNLPSLAVRLRRPTPKGDDTESDLEPTMWEEDGTDPYASVRERISTCQDRITEHAWVLGYGAAALRSAQTRSTNSLTTGWGVEWDIDKEDGNLAGWERESGHSNARIEHFQHLQHHYLALMEHERRIAHVRTYYWGWEREGLRSA